MAFNLHPAAIHPYPAMLLAEDKWLLYGVLLTPSSSHSPPASSHSPPATPLIALHLQPLNCLMAFNLHPEALLDKGEWQLYGGSTDPIQQPFTPSQQPFTSSPSTDSSSPPATEVSSPSDGFSPPSSAIHLHPLSSPQVSSASLAALFIERSCP